MIIKSMSLSARKELLASVRQKYRDSSWIDKGKILDGFVAATGYDRKHAIQLMNSAAEPEKPKERLASQKYDEQTRQALYWGCKPESQKISSMVNVTFFTAKMQSG